MDRLALTIAEAAKAGGPKRAKLYEEIRSGRLRAVKVGRSTRILVRDFQQYLASLPTIEPKGGIQPKNSDRIVGTGCIEAEMPTKPRAIEGPRK